MTKSPLIVLTSRVFPETRAMLERVARVVANEGSEPWSQDEVIERCREATGLMAFMTDRIDRAFLERCPQLKVIGAALKGYDNIDVDAARERGVQVTIVPDLLTEPTAELAIGLMIALGRHIPLGDAGIRRQGFAGWRPQLYGTGIGQFDGRDRRVRPGRPGHRAPAPADSAAASSHSTAGPSTQAPASSGWHSMTS